MLPGGAGTLDELFEVLTWRQLGLHAKPVFLLNTEGYWDRLVALIEGMVREVFAGPDILDYYRVVPDVATLGAGLDAALS